MQCKAPCTNSCTSCLRSWTPCYTWIKFSFWFPFLDARYWHTELQSLFLILKQWRCLESTFCFWFSISQINPLISGQEALQSAPCHIVLQWLSRLFHSWYYALAYCWDSARHRFVQSIFSESSCQLISKKVFTSLYVLNHKVESGQEDGPIFNFWEVLSRFIWANSQLHEYK